MAFFRQLSFLSLFLFVLLSHLGTAQRSEEIVRFEVPEGGSHLSKRQSSAGSGAPYWFSEIERQGTVAYGTNSSYVLYRNVKDYGATGDGVTDDTYAINNATFDGNRCQYPTCQSETTTPAIIYFPPGTYLITAPLVMLYYTQFVGDANNLPTIKGDPSFNGIGLLDSDPYVDAGGGTNWYINQNNFWRHVRNFILDITELPPDGFHCIHWQVAQGTSVQNVIFNMVEDSTDNKQFGIFMDNGSGGWFEDLIFNGGGVGLYAGNQQWTSRNMTFNNCLTAVYQNWGWVFDYKSIYINNCNVGFDFTNGGGTVIIPGSFVIQDSVFTNVATAAVLTTFSANSTPAVAGTLVMDNNEFINTPNAVAYPNGTVIVPGNQVVPMFMQGRVYSAFDSQEQFGNLTCYEPAANYARVQQVMATSVPKPASLLDSTGKIYERGKPQYEGLPYTSFISIKTFGCTGDGVTDDTECVQNYLNSITIDQIAFIDHGAYVISDTIEVPINIKMVGEIWPLFMVDGSSATFADQNNPKPAFRVGQPGDFGAVEMQEIIFETLGPAPGAIMMEWNLNGNQGDNCMWDVHWRIGGSNGTQLQYDQCPTNPLIEANANRSCIGAFMLLHLTSTSSVLMANNWGWVSDHDMEIYSQSQINIYNGRGILIESQGPVWLYGQAWEHSMLYNMQIANAKEIYVGIYQSETAYMQANPNALQPFPPLESWSDPTFPNCYASTCWKTFGLRIFNSTNILMYGLGLYSFFDNYQQGCLLTSNCQQNMIDIAESEGIYMFAVNTKASTNMVQVDGVELVPGAPNENNFADTLAVFEYP